MTAPQAVERIPKQPCRGCSGLVMHVEDVDTGEPIVVDDHLIDGGHILVWALKQHAFARRYGQPARIQPAWREHNCPTPTVVVPAAVPVDDPYEDKPAAVHQHGGWRA